MERSRKRLAENIVPCRTMDEVGAAIDASKFALYEWDASDNIKDSRLEAEIKERFKATTRCLPKAGQFTVIDDFSLEREHTVKVILARSF